MLLLFRYSLPRYSLRTRSFVSNISFVHIIFYSSSFPSIIISVARSRAEKKSRGSRKDIFSISVFPERRSRKKLYRFSIVSFQIVGPRPSPSTKVVLKFRVGAEGGSVKGGPFYRGQTENALFIGRSDWQFIEFPLKVKELRWRVVGGVTQAAGMKTGGREEEDGGGVKWHLFPSPFAHSHAYTYPAWNGTTLSWPLPCQLLSPLLPAFNSFAIRVSIFKVKHLADIRPVLYVQYPRITGSLIQTFSLYPENKWFVSFRGTNCGW